VGQVLTNLISNAVDASLSQAEVTGAGEVKVLAEATSNGIAFSVSDNGPGVPEELREKIIEPFFTTKGVGKGTGLGMPICVRIIEAHDSKLEIHQDPKLHGAMFRFELINMNPGNLL
jgi:signal transduction histidine kinase